MPKEVPEELRNLLAKPMLWPEEVRRVHRLAHRYGVNVRIERREFNDWEAGWRQVGAIDDSKVVEGAKLDATLASDRLRTFEAA